MPDLTRTGTRLHAQVANPSLLSRCCEDTHIVSHTAEHYHSSEVVHFLLQVFAKVHSSSLFMYPRKIIWS
ncbi:MAG: hypothetical protein OSA77_14320, partial [Halioglobus sp.]|nr:hypothetical protein [Halioglobus sp.]